jgi:hypothetical protein
LTDPAGAAPAPRRQTNAKTPEKWNMFDLTPYYHFVDQWLLPLYRLPENPVVGFLAGTFALALIAVLIGDLTFNIALRVNRRRMSEVTGETVRMNNLTIDALRAGDGESYRACNRLANDSFGKMFFLQATLSMSSLWPLPFALAWMEYRFFGVEFPLWPTSHTLEYPAVIIPMYILARILYGRVKHRLPFLGDSRRIMAEMGLQAGRMRSWGELFPAREKKSSAKAA